MTNKMTSVMGRIRLNAATPIAGTSTIRISSVPYAEEEIPSGDSTPSASGLDSRCSPRSWLTSGGPSSRRFVEYQNVSGRPPLLSSSAAAFRVATGLRLSSATSDWGGRDLIPSHSVCRNHRPHTAWSWRSSWPTWEGVPGTSHVHPPRRDYPGRRGDIPNFPGRLTIRARQVPMTTTPAGPQRSPRPQAADKATLRLSRLLERPVSDRGGESIGRLADLIVRLRGTDYPLVTGLVAAVGGREIFVPIDQVSSFDGDPLRLSSARLSLRHFGRRDGEVLLRADVLGHRLIDVPNARLVRAADLELARAGPDWIVAGVDTRPRRMFGLRAPQTPAGRGGARDWHDFEWLIGHVGSALLRGPFA